MQERLRLDRRSLYPEAHTVAVSSGLASVTTREVDEVALLRQAVRLSCVAANEARAA